MRGCRRGSLRPWGWTRRVDTGLLRDSSKGLTSLRLPGGGDGHYSRALLLCEAALLLCEAALLLCEAVPPDPRTSLPCAMPTPDPRPPQPRHLRLYSRALWWVPASPGYAEGPQHQPCAWPSLLLWPRLLRVQMRGLVSPWGASLHGRVFPWGGLAVSPKSHASQGQGWFRRHRPVTKPG